MYSEQAQMCPVGCKYFLLIGNFQSMELEKLWLTWWSTWSNFFTLIKVDHEEVYQVCIKQRTLLKFIKLIKQLDSFERSI